jgi:hypothetical protein
VKKSDFSARRTYIETISITKALTAAKRCRVIKTLDANTIPPPKPNQKLYITFLKKYISIFGENLKTKETGD